MNKKVLAYLLLFIFSSQAAIASIDLHLILDSNDNEIVDVVHHFVDEHIENIACDDTNNSNSEHNENDAHHGCSGHITSFNNHNFEAFTAKSNHSERVNRYTIHFISVTQPPLLRPPALS